VLEYTNFCTLELKKDSSASQFSCYHTIMDRRQASAEQVSGRLCAFWLFNEHLMMAREQHSTAYSTCYWGRDDSTNLGVMYVMQVPRRCQIRFCFDDLCSFWSELQAKESSSSKTNDHVSMKYPQANAQLGNPECDNLVTKPAKCASALADNVKTLALLSSYLGPAGQLCLWCQKFRWELVTVTSWSWPSCIWATYIEKGYI